MVLSLSLYFFELSVLRLFLTMSQAAFGVEPLATLAGVEQCVHYILR